MNGSCRKKLRMTGKKSLQRSKLGSGTTPPPCKADFGSPKQTHKPNCLNQDAYQGILEEDEQDTTKEANGASKLLPP